MPKSMSDYLLARAAEDAQAEAEGPEAVASLEETRKAVSKRFNAVVVWALKQEVSRRRKMTPK